MQHGGDGATCELASAFRSALRADACQLLAALPSEPHAPHQGSIVWFDGEELRIPSRIYNAEPTGTAVASLSTAQLLLLHCLYSRHHDGYVRQRHLTCILGEPRPWTAPFALGLLGEYVIEIHVVLQANLNVVTSAPYREFCALNPAFVEFTKRRIVSYWDCYHRCVPGGWRPEFRRFVVSPAYLVADALGWWNPRELRRLRAR